MGKAVFTHGEWKVVNGNYPSIIEIKCGERMRIPVVLSATDVTYEQSLEREANAHLIAAAPEMYEMLDCILDSLGDEFQLPKDIKLDVEHLLAKARGEL